MIVTLTANPSLDRTLGLDHSLVPGGVHRAVGCTDEPGGKGVNVSRAVGAAGHPTVAVLPARAEDPVLAQMRLLDLAHHAVHVDDLVRVNLTVTDPDGTTTKLNLPGSPLTASAAAELTDVLLKEAADARWAVLSGSLPPGVSPQWYAELTEALHAQRCRVAVDTSGEPLRSAVSGATGSRPDLLKPNAEELAEVLGLDHDDVADPQQAAQHARRLLGDGCAAVLVTLGADGAVLVTDEGTWHAAPPPTTPKSTVGAGDCALAGYLLADLDGAAAPDRLRRAVAYGSAAAGLPGSAVPEPADVRPETVTVTALNLTQQR
jgi:1-phosphofructokinase